MNTTLESVNQFIDWTQRKMVLNCSQINFNSHRKEIWWASLGRNIGIEANGKHNRFERPVLIINVFNSDSVFIVSLTSKAKDNDYSYVFVDSIGIRSSVNISQLRTISTKRLLRKISDISDVDFSNVVHLIQKLVLKEETPFGVSSESFKEESNVAEVSRGTSSELPLQEHNINSL